MGPNGASSGCQFRKIATETRRQHIQLHPRTCAATQQQELLAVPKESSLGPLPNEPDQSEASLGNKGCAWKDRDIHAVGLFPNSALRPTGGRVCGKTSENLAGEYLCPGRPLLSTSPAFFPPKKVLVYLPFFFFISSHQRKSSPPNKTITMASSRVFASRLASQMAATTKVARPAARFAAPKRTFTTQRKTAIPMTPFQTVKRQQPSMIQANARQVFANVQARRQYSSEIADAMVQVSQNMGMGSAAIGLGGAGIGIGLVFGALLLGVSRNPALRGQLFSYAILGFAFVEAIGLFDLMVAMMCKYV